MRQPGQVVLFPFPHSDQTKAKLRPGLLIGKTPGNYDDWLICMISSQLHHEIKNFDEVIKEADSDFSSAGLKTASLIRLGRLAVVEGSMLLGAIGNISMERLARIRRNLSTWMAGT